MSDLNDITKKAKRSLTDPILGAIEKPFRTGATGARKEAAAMAKKQQQLDAAALAETEDEIARKRGAAASGGRRSLIATSPTGLNKTLGGGNGAA